MRRITLAIVTMLLCTVLQAQVGINSTGAAPDAGAMLDVASSEKGFLPPRMSTEARDAMVNVTAGMTIYNIEEGCLNLFNGLSWESLCGGGATSNLSYTMNFDKTIVTVGIDDTSNEDPLTILLHRISGTPSLITLELSGVPSGVTYSLSPGGGFPDVAATLIFTTSNMAVAGAYSLTVTASGGLANLSATFILEIVGEKRIFLTDGFSQSGNLGGLSGADAICQSQANANSLGGTWVAWLSTSTVDARDRIGNGIFKRLDDVIIAHNKADLLDGTLLAAPRMTASGEYTGAWARTGTLGDGTAAIGSTCNDWTSSAGLVVVGDPDSYNSTDWWTNRTSGNCNELSYRLYCIEQ